eukprot:1153032-Pelagomonas_calceolata.AAC.3
MHKEWFNFIPTPKGRKITSSPTFRKHASQQTSALRGTDAIGDCFSKACKHVKHIGLPNLRL